MNNGVLDQTKRSFQQFIFPFMLDEDKIEGFVNRLLLDEYVFFEIDNLDLQDDFYGNQRVSHRNIDQYFMPNIVPVLFPKSHKQKAGLRRFSKKMDLGCTFRTPFLNTGFIINSIDIIICPFHIGMINIRVTLPEQLSYNDVLYFTDTFRVLEPITDDEREMNVGCRGIEYDFVKDFIFKELVPPAEKFIDDEEDHPSHFGSLPFFVDERMFAISYIAVPKEREITKSDIYRLSQLNGYDEDGEPYISALNPKYIDRYYQERVYDRWGKETYFVTNEGHFACVTRATGKLENQLGSEMYGQYFYSILIYLFYKIVLLKLAHEHSRIDVEKDQSETELLIFMITEFSAKYLFAEVNSTSTGKELFHITKEIFKIDSLYQEVKETLSYLYQNQDKLSGKSSHYLLQILTIYTVISGIFGMNLHIENLKKKLTFEDYMHYTLFEWVAVLVTISGLVISFVMGFLFLKSWIYEQKSRKKKVL